MTEFNVFCFWESGYADNEKGADPEAEEAFINELLGSLVKGDAARAQKNL